MFKHPSVALVVVSLAFLGSCRGDPGPGRVASPQPVWLSVPVLTTAQLLGQPDDPATATPADQPQNQGSKGQPDSPASPADPAQPQSPASPEAPKPRTQDSTTEPGDTPASTTDEVSAAASAESKVGYKDATVFFPMEVSVWTAYGHVSELSIETPHSLSVQTKGYEETLYLHPHIHANSSIKPLLMRAIANDHKRQNFDMRDAVVLPMPSKLSAPLVPVANRILSFSYCILDSTFTGERDKTATLDVSIKGKDGPTVVMTRTINLADDPRCTQWTEVRQDLPVPTGDAETLSFSITPKSPRARQGLVLGNISVLARLDSPQKVIPETLAKDLGPAASPNILVVFIDAGRGDCVGPANTTFPSVTPTIDALAKDGVTFTRSYSVSNQTRPSITGFLQSQHPTVGGFHSQHWNLKPNVISSYYERRPPLLPLMLTQAGYYTASIGRNHFQYGVTPMALDPGFEVIWDNRFGQTDTVHIINRSIQFVKENKDRKFFLQVNISPTHQPYNPPEKYKKWAEQRLARTPKTPARKDYLAELYYADQEVGRLLTTMRELGLDKKTVILITADHGETMHNDHSCYSEVFKTICHTSHGLTLYDEEIHVPLIFAAPFVEGLEPQVRDNVVSALDVAPTLLTLAGLPQTARHMGRSLLPDLTGAKADDEEIYVESRLSSGVRIDEWKFIYHHKKDDARTPAWKTGGEKSDQELYDLTRDPFETENIYRSNPEKTEFMRGRLGALRTGYTEKEAATRGVTWSPSGVSAPPTEGTGSRQSPSGDSGPSTAGPTAGKTNSSDESGTAGSEDGQDLDDGAPPAGASSAPAQVLPGFEAPATAADDESVLPGGQNGQKPGTVSHRPTASSGYLSFALNPGGAERHFLGSIRTVGRIVSLEALESNDCIVLALTHELTVDCTLTNRPFQARMKVEPPDSPVDFNLSMGPDAKVDAAHFYVGRFGVSLLPKPSIESDEDYVLAHSGSKPHFLAAFDPGVFVWHNRRTGCGEGGGEAGFMGQETIEDEATRNVLRELGYWQ